MKGGIFLSEQPVHVQQEKIVTTTTPKRKKAKRSSTKPAGFQELEELTKDILDGQGKSYFEWLHEKHQEVVLKFNLLKKEEIAILAQEEE